MWLWDCVDGRRRQSDEVEFAAGPEPSSKARLFFPVLSRLENDVLV